MIEFLIANVALLGNVYVIGFLVYFALRSIIDGMSDYETPVSEMLLESIFWFVQLFRLTGVLIKGVYDARK